jgi:hypothetical protein
MTDSTREQGPSEGSSVVPHTSETPEISGTEVAGQLETRGIGTLARTAVRGFLPANVGMMVGSSIGFSMVGALPLSSWIIAATGLSLGFDVVQVTLSLRRKSQAEVSTRRSMITGFFATLAVGAVSLLSGVTDPVFLFVLGLVAGVGLALKTLLRRLRV